ncbi:hypothetical protein C491_20971 [Natronococcus amylolyticus DSM 10524]|uniref:C2H2-type domain-containing protein n=1 Tax=Natronococcus amylolyticus DSM 10524 TaxID=1227497 RepID=L9WW65_9EURY|nr:hypothetical protein [Natronococcus amylolyticus]ELY53652.1 hypothetical protein C491_20971 [Natronococcus amylolyticus DSM 10524]
MTNDSAVETYECPSPDCSQNFGAQAEFTEHINAEHAGEYNRKDWPDTPAGRASRRDRASDEDDEE